VRASIHRAADPISQRVHRRLRAPSGAASRHRHDRSCHQGQQATFLVAGSGSARRRDARRQRPDPGARNDNNTQYTATLAEWHDLVRKTGFNIFASQGNQRAIMQHDHRGVINRKIDVDIITELNTATQDTGTATTASLNLALYAKTILGNAAVPFDGNIFAAITPAFEAYMLQVKEFASSQYVTWQPLASARRRSPTSRWPTAGWA
jgi:hypothetical protein